MLINILCKFLVCLAGIMLLICSCINAQSQVKPFTISGFSNLMLQLSDRSGYQTPLPRNFLRWNLASTLSFYDLPVRVSLMLTTEDESSRQSSRYYSVSFRPADVLRRKVREQAAGKFLPRLFSLFPVIEIGNCHPAYSLFTMQGITLSKGVNIEFAPGNFRLGFAAGRAAEAVRSTDPYYQAYRKEIYAGRIGIASESRGSLMFTILSARDQGSSMDPVPSYHYIKPDTLCYLGDTFYHNQDTFATKYKPMANKVISTDYKLVLVKDKLNVSGELAASLTTDDLNALNFENTDIEDYLPSWADFNTTSHLGYAWRQGFNFRTQNTDIKGSVSRVSPGYFSEGLPFLRNDLLSGQASLNQTFWQRRLSFYMMFKETSDNLMGQKLSTTQTRQYGITIGLRVPKIPWVSLMFMPFTQNNNHPERIIDNSTMIISINVGFPYVICHSASANTGISLLLQNGSYLTAGTRSTHRSEYFQLNQNVNINQSIGLSAALGYSKIAGVDSTRLIYHFYLGNSCILLKKMKNSFGVRGVTDREFSLMRWSGWLRFNISLNRFSEVSLSLEKSQYSALQESGPDADELIFRLNFIIKW